MTDATPDYSKTVLLPNPAFPLKAGLAEREPKQIEAWDKAGAYAELRRRRAGAPKWVLHDGPPFANGDIHMGHALNKSLKDILVRYKSLQGFDAPYVPGWDCHGMPIEFKVNKEWPKDGPAKTPLSIRQRCRAEAEKWVARQKEEFRRLGVWGDFGRPYLTLSKEFEAHQLDAYWELVKKGQIYRDLKPVYWCVHDQTALAEAELEYQDHSSDSVYVKFEVAGADAVMGKAVDGMKTQALIWTTTPWTLPANLAIALNPEFEYAAYAVADEAMIVAKGLAAAVFQKLNYEELPAVLWEGKGRELEGLVYRPFMGVAGNLNKLVMAPYVTLEAGTGLVHTAPGHGADDYVTGVRNGLQVYCPVTDDGRYDPAMVSEPSLQGMRVTDPKVNQAVIALLRERGTLVHHEAFSHSYPHCWRCKHPIIFRATKQWFMSLDRNGLRDNTMAEIQKVKWINPWGADRMANMMKDRADWCISRQRSWGFPIIMWYCSKCLEYHFDEACYRKAREVVAAKGTDAWFEDAEQFKPEAMVCGKCGASGPAGFAHETNTLDVWFDSGSSHLAVLAARPELHWPADLYLEGSDQYRGWFQSSMLVAVGVRGAAPYRAVVSHGWVLDSQGRAMHKSAGNTVDPLKVMQQYGADIIRLWAASQDFMADDRVGEDILKRTADAYRRIRNSFRWLLGALDGFDPARHAVADDALQPLDRWLLAELDALTASATAHMDAYELYLATSELVQFCSVQLSSQAFDIHKDTLYTLAAADPARRSAQTAFHRCLMALVRMLSPILPFTCDEVWAQLPAALTGGLGSVHFSDWPKPRPAGAADEAVADYDLLLSAVRPVVTKALEEARAAKSIGHPYDAELALTAHSKRIFKALQRREAELARFFVVSKVELRPAAPRDGELLEPGEVEVRVSPHPKCARCWRHVEDVGSHAQHPALCGRCVAALG